MKTAALEADYHSHIKANVFASQAFDDIGRVSAWWAKNFEGSARKGKFAATIDGQKGQPT